MNLIASLPSSLSCAVMNVWIELKDVARLDSAFCIGELRPTILALLSSTECVIETKTESSHRAILSWLLKRAVKVRYFCISRNIDEDLGVQYMKKHGSQVTTIVREKDYTLQDEADNLGIVIIKQACEYDNLVCFHGYDLSVQFLDDIRLRCPSIQKLHFSTLRESVTKLSTHALLPSVKDLSLCGNESIVLDVISRCPNLIKLNVNCFHTALTDANLVTIAEQNRQLRYLGLWGQNSSDYAFNTMATMCTKMINLDLYFTTVTDEVIECVAVAMKHLRGLSLQFCRELTNASLHSLATHRASTLECLLLHGSVHMTSEAVLTLRSKIPALYVDWHMYIASKGDLSAILTDYAACTALSVCWPIQDLLPIASHFTHVAILCLDTQKASESAAALSDTVLLIHSLPCLQTIIVAERDLPAVKSIVSTALRSSITVTSTRQSLYVNLQNFDV